MHIKCGASQVALVVKGLPENAGHVEAGSILGSGRPLAEEMAAPSSILAGASQGQRSLAGCSPQGAKSLTQLSDFTHTHAHI